jgi:hypothetical protein
MIPDLSHTDPPSPPALEAVLYDSDSDTKMSDMALDWEEVEQPSSGSTVSWISHSF